MGLVDDYSAATGMQGADAGRPLWPVLIASKGRARALRWPEGLRYDDVHIVVEPQEADDYELALGQRAQLLVLPDNNRGLPYLRNWALGWATRAGHRWYWMLDDDVTGWYMARPVPGSGKLRRCVRTTAREVLLAAQAVVERYPDAAIGALEYQQYAWSAASPVKLNSYADVVVAYRTGLFGLHWDETLLLKADRDYALKALANGHTVVRSTHTAFGSPKNGTQKGGQQPLYNTPGVEEQYSRELARRWPGIVTVHRKPDGRMDAKINWKLFAPDSVQAQAQAARQIGDNARAIRDRSRGKAAKPAPHATQAASTATESRSTERDTDG